MDERAVIKTYHVLFRRLHHAGHTRQSLCHILGIHQNNYRQTALYPLYHLNALQIVLIATILDIAPADAFDTLFNHPSGKVTTPKTGPTGSKAWHDE